MILLSGFLASCSYSLVLLSIFKAFRTSMWEGMSEIQKHWPIFLLITYALRNSHFYGKWILTCEFSQDLIMCEFWPLVKKMRPKHDTWQERINGKKIKTRSCENFTWEESFPVFMCYTQMRNRVNHGTKHAVSVL